MATLGLQLAPDAAQAYEGFPVKPQREGQIAMRTLKDSELIISFFPKFTYDARGGGGLSDAPVTSDGRTAVKFDLQTLNIPAVSYKTASFLGVPMLPGVKIAIEPSMLEAAPLMVNTLLTTETVHGKKHSIDRKGSRMDSDGYAKLVGVSNVPKSGDRFMDSFLRLPTDALALMSCQFVFT